MCYSSVYIDLVFFATMLFTYDKVLYVKIRAYDIKNIIRIRIWSSFAYYHSPS